MIRDKCCRKGDCGNHPKGGPMWLDDKDSVKPTIQAANLGKSGEALPMYSPLTENTGGSLWWILARSCNLDCIYCLDPDTPILTENSGWIPLKDIQIGDTLIAFDEDSPGEGKHRNIRLTRVTHKWNTRKKALKITTNRSEVVCSKDHLWLSDIGRWRKASNLGVGDSIKGLSTPVTHIKESTKYQWGYVAGMVEGDGWISSWVPCDGYKRYGVRVAVKDEVILDRLGTYLSNLGIDFLQKFDEYLGLPSIYSRKKATYDKLISLMSIELEAPGDIEYARGWIAGIFDAEGSYRRDSISSNSLRISNKDEGIIRKTQSFLDMFGFKSCVDSRESTEVRNVRLIGGIEDIVRFRCVYNPAVLNKVKLHDQGFRSSSSKITRIEEVGEKELIDITTTTGTFIAAGLASHNCYQGSHKWKWQPSKGLIKRMPDEVFEKALPWALKWSRNNFKINCYGGEPLLSFDQMQKWVSVWDEAFHKAGKRLTWGVTTNGTMLDERVRVFLDEYEFGILLSLDGPPRTHNQTRVFYGNKPSWDSIPVDEILEWRPNIEIAWQLDPGIDFNEDDLAWMLDKGFSQINFNINWLKDWEPTDQIRLQRFFRVVGRFAIQTAKKGGVVPWDGCSEAIKKVEGKRLLTNFFGKFNEALIKTDRMKQPCGTGLAMLALTPEGYLYPSQEMAFSSFEPNRAPGTAEYYRVGNVHNDPVIDMDRLAVVSTIQTADMRTPEGYNCNNCINKPISIGGSCHDLDEDTPVMLATGQWIPIKDVKVGDKLVGTSGDPTPDLKVTKKRFWEISEVTDVLTKPRYPVLNIETDYGDIKASVEHPFLVRMQTSSIPGPTAPNGHWQHVWKLAGELKVGDYLIAPSVAISEPANWSEYRRGYMYGLVIGDGSIIDKTYVSYRDKAAGESPFGDGSWRRTQRSTRVDVAVNDVEIIDRYEEYASVEFPDSGFKRYMKPGGGFNKPTTQPAVRNARRRIHTEFRDMWNYESTKSADFLRGFLGGIFDAEGSMTGNKSKYEHGEGALCDLKICQDEVNRDKKLKIAYALDYFGFMYRWDPKWLRIKGGRKERFRFLSLALPACERKVANFIRGQVCREYNKITNITPAGFSRVVNLETTTRNFLTPVGVVHNCRVVGLDGEHAEDRYYVYPGYCASQQSVQTGILQAAMIERYIGFKSSQPAKSSTATQGKTNGKLDISDLDQKLDKILNKLDHGEEAPNKHKGA